jgi:hypothetical protein
MALRYAFGAFVWNTADAAGTNYSHTLAWSPKAMRFWLSGQTGLTNTWSRRDVRACQGFAASPSDRRCMGVYSQDAAGSSNCGLVNQADAILATCDGNGNVTGLLDITSMSAGFQATVDQQGPVDLTVFWEAWYWDGSAVACTGEITEPAATGNQDYVTSAAVPVGLAFFSMAQTTTAAPTVSAADSSFCIGVASGPSNQWVFAHNADDASPTMDTDKYARSDECIAIIVVAGGNPNARATWVQKNSDGFRLNWLARNGTRKVHYLAIPDTAGPLAAGTFTLNRQTVGNTATVSGLPFTPTAMMFCGHGSPEQAAGTSTGVFNVIVGMYQGGRRQCFNSHDENGTADSVCHSGVWYDATLKWEENNGTQVVFAHDVDALFKDGFRVRVSETDFSINSADMIGYVAFGETDWIPKRGSAGQFARLRR